MANSLISERYQISKIGIVGDYIVSIKYSQMGTFANGVEVEIAKMTEYITPDTDLYNDDPDHSWYCTDEVRAVCEGQFDEETLTEWKEFSEYDKSQLLDNL